MLKIINVGKIEITCDLEDILRKIDSFVYSKALYSGLGTYGVKETYHYTEEEWLIAKNKLMNEIRSLIDSDDKLQALLLKTVSINKNGTLSKNRRNVVLKFECVNSYTDMFGCHSFYVNALMIQRISDYQGNLILSEYRDQCSF